jgi:type VI secretion system protein ImpJ
VHLAVADHARGRPSVQGALARYEVIQGASVADLNTGGDDLGIDYLSPRLHLKVENVLPQQYVGFPLARVTRDGEVHALTEYEPPRLRVPESSLLGKYCAEIAGLLREKAMALAERQHGNVRAAGDLPSLGKQIRIQHMVAGLPRLEALLYTNTAHPFDLYTALWAIAGHVACLTSTLVPPVPPAYDHDDPGAVFRHVCGYIRDALGEGIIEAHTPYPFVQQGNVFSLRFDAMWASAPLILGACARAGMSERDIAEWVENSLIASSSWIPKLRTMRITGAGRRRIPGDGDLAPRPGELLYAIELESGFIVPHEWLEIRNLDDPQGEHAPAEIVLYVGSQTHGAR